MGWNPLTWPAAIVNTAYTGAGYIAHGLDYVSGGTMGSKDYGDALLSAGNPKYIEDAYRHPASTTKEGRAAQSAEANRYDNKVQKEILPDIENALTLNGALHIDDLIAARDKKSFIDELLAKLKEVWATMGPASFVTGGALFAAGAAMGNPLLGGGLAILGAVAGQPLFDKISHAYNQNTAAAPPTMAMNKPAASSPAPQPQTAQKIDALAAPKMVTNEPNPNAGLPMDRDGIAAFSKTGGSPKV